MENMLKRRTKGLTPKQHNIFKYLSTHGTMVRDELEKGLNIPHTTIYNNLVKLEKKRIVIRFSKPNNKKGRQHVYWSIKQAQDLVLFKVQDLVLFVKQAQDLVLKKNGEDKHLTYIFKKIEEPNLTNQKISFNNKPFNNKPTSSYILTNKDSKLIKFVLDEINKCTYFRTPTISKIYVNKILKIRYVDIKEDVRRSTSVKIGWIVRELDKLGIITRHTGTVRSVWKNLYKGNLYDALDKKMEQNYFMIKMKK